MSKSCEVSIQYFAPPANLRLYCSTFFLSEITVPDGETVEDFLFPEWATLRFSSTPPPVDAEQPALAEMRSGQKLHNSRFPVMGPRSQEIRFRVGTTRIWSINLNPVGWVRFIGRPAHEFANVMLDGFDDPVFARFWPLADSIFGAEPDPAAELARLTRFLEDLEVPEVPNEQRILDVFLAMLDPAINSVADFANRLAISQRTLERICLQAFGFPPKLLLRRQRFMRSLTDYTLDPSLKWIGAMDALYHDQAQFVRDFREFMGMTPSEYAALEKPIMGPVMRERVEHFREVMRTARSRDDQRECSLPG